LGHRAAARRVRGGDLRRRRSLARGGGPGRGRSGGRDRGLVPRAAGAPQVPAPRPVRRGAAARAERQGAQARAGGRSPRRSLTGTAAPRRVAPVEVSDRARAPATGTAKTATTADAVTGRRARRSPGRSGGALGGPHAG